MVEQLAWLAEAGFACTDVLWKNMHFGLFCGIRDHIHMPEGDNAEGEAHAHAH
jgi:hypothetical protein